MLFELVLHFGDQIEVGHTVAQVGQRGLIGRFGDLAGLAHDGDLISILDATQGH